MESLAVAAIGASRSEFSAMDSRCMTVSEIGTSVSLLGIGGTASESACAIVVCGEECSVLSARRSLAACVEVAMSSNAARQTRLACPFFHSITHRDHVDLAMVKLLFNAENHRDFIPLCLANRLAIMRAKVGLFLKSWYLLHDCSWLGVLLVVLFLGYTVESKAQAKVGVLSLIHI